MPPISIFLCKFCKTYFHIGWGGYQYVISDAGKSIPCPHPVEEDKISKVLHIDIEEMYQVQEDHYKWQKPAWWWSKKRRKRYEQVKQLLKDRTGFNSFCICLSCKKGIALDMHKEKRQCPACGSSSVKTILELVGRTCPLCRAGRIQEIETGAES